MWGINVGKKRIEYEEFDLIEDNLKDYKKKRVKPLCDHHKYRLILCVYVWSRKIVPTSC